MPANWRHSKYQINIKYNKTLGYWNTRCYWILLYMKQIRHSITRKCQYRHLVCTVMELSTLFRERTGLLSSNELSSSQLVGLDLKLRTFMARAFFSFLADVCLCRFVGCVALGFERQTFCKCPTLLQESHVALMAPHSSGLFPSVPPHL